MKVTFPTVHSNHHDIPLLAWAELLQEDTGLEHRPQTLNPKPQHPH